MAELWFFAEAPPPRPEPLSISSELREEPEVVAAEAMPIAEPPELEADPDAPEARILDDTVIPAPWLRPQDDHYRSRDDLPRASAERGDLAKKLRPEVEASASQEPIPETQAPADAPSARDPSPAVTRAGAEKLDDQCPSPIYPASALRRGHEGRVVLIVDVDAGGAVISLTLQTSSGYDSLDRAAIAAVENWRFSPARENGQAVRDRVQVPITFRQPR